MTAEPNDVHSHAGERVTWERLRSSHSGMRGLEPWERDAPNEGHRVYKQDVREACYMCMALALIDEVTRENADLRARLAAVETKP